MIGERGITLTHDMTVEAQLVKPAEAASNIAKIIKVKNGYKTSEFWQSMVVNVASLFGAVFPNDPIIVKVTGLVIAAINTVAYIASRASVKKHALTLRAETLNPQSVSQNPLDFLQ